MSECAKGKSGGIYFKVTDEERGLIEQRMALMGVHNMSAYIRKMCIDGYIVQLQIKELDECAKLLRYTSNNVNQIARRVNSGGGVYPDEVDEICGKLTEASGLFGNILEKKSKIKCWILGVMLYAIIRYRTNHILRLTSSIRRSKKKGKVFM